MANVLVSDFDGTMTRRDFYQVFLERFEPPGASAYWDDYLTGRLTHFEALRAIFGSVAPGEPALLEVVESMELEDQLKAEVESLDAADWRVVVASAGSNWYIDRLLGSAGITLEVHSNPGRIERGRLVMGLPADSRFFSEQTGIDKSAVVRAASVNGGLVAFAGDGKPDLAPSLLVPGRLRFARSFLAEALTRLGEDFQPFERWAEVSGRLRSMTGPAEDGSLRGSE